MSFRKLGASTVVRKIFGGRQEQSNSDCLSDLIAVLNLGQSHIEELRERNEDIRHQLENAENENRDLEFRNSLLKAQVEIVSIESVESKEWMGIFILGCVQVAFYVARLKQMVDAYYSFNYFQSSVSAETADHGANFRIVVGCIFALLASFGAVLYNAYNLPSKYALFFSCALLLVNYGADFLVDVPKIKVIPPSIFGIALAFFDGVRLCCLKQCSQRHHLARNIAVADAIGTIGITAGAICYFPAFGLEQQVNQTSNENLLHSPTEEHYILMYLIFGTTLSIVAIFLLPTENLFATQRKTGLLPDVIPKQQHSWFPGVRGFFQQLCSSDHNAGIALGTLFLFLVLCSIFSGYTHLIFTSSATMLLLKKYPENATAFPEYVFAFGITASFCNTFLACMYNGSRKILLMFITVNVAFSASVYLLCSRQALESESIIDGVTMGMMSVFVLHPIYVIICMNYNFLYGFVRSIQVIVKMCLVLTIASPTDIVWYSPKSAFYFVIVGVSIFFAIFITTLILIFMQREKVAVARPEQNGHIDLT